MQVNPFRPAVATMSAWHTIREGFQYVGGTMPMRAIVQLTGDRQFCGSALHGADADLRRPHPAWRGAGAGYPDGRDRVGRAGRRAADGIADGAEGFYGLDTGGRGGLCGVAGGIFVSSSMWLSCVMLFVAGFAVMIQVGASNTLIQSMVPDHLRGRAMSVYSMMYIGIGSARGDGGGFCGRGLGARMDDSGRCG